MRLHLPVAYLASILLVGSLEAQQPGGVVRGRIIDTLKAPIAGVIIESGALETKSRNDGSFELSGFGLGEARLYLRHVGYAPVSVTVRFYTIDTVQQTFTMTRATALDTMRVMGDSAPALGLSTFERRRRGGSGTFLTEADFAKSGAQGVGDIIGSYVGFRTVSVCGQSFVTSRRGGVPGATSAPGSGQQAARVEPPRVSGGCPLPKACYSQVFMDGIRMYSMTGPLHAGSPIPPNFNYISLFNLHGLEFYRGSAETPSELNGTGAVCGTIAIWTRR